jgi:hypothetical protein
MSRYSALDADARPRAKAGRARMAEIAAQNQVEIDALAVDLLQSLCRPPLPAERLLAEAIGAATVRCRRLREQGKCDTADRRDLSRLLRSFNALPKPVRAALA